MIAEIITLSITLLICVVMGVLVLIGKGDILISGYNTASPEERAQYNIRRLRLIVGGGTILISTCVTICCLLDNVKLLFVFIIPITIAIVTLSNTWAKN